METYLGGASGHRSSWMKGCLGQYTRFFSIWLVFISILIASPTAFQWLEILKFKPFSVTSFFNSQSNITAQALKTCLDHRYRPTILSHDPLVIYLEDFVSASEISYLKSITSASFQETLSHEYESHSAPRRRLESQTSTSTYLPVSDPVVSCIGRRALEFQGPSFKAADFGNPRLVKYTASQKIDYHFDWWQEPQDRYGRFYNRATTFFVYLHANCTGGGTHFPDLALSSMKSDRRLTMVEGANGVLFHPIAGNAIFWVNLHANRTGDERNIHAGLPVIEGEKIAMNIWPPMYY